MSGHSKWNNIKRKKEKTDSQRAKIFTKIGRELAVAVRDGGGPDPSVNYRLKECISKAKENNVPNDNIERIIKKAAGEGNLNKYESITYEGYGPGGSAFIVDTLTDNRNRTAGNLRHYFDKYGGNLGTSGCVSFMFCQKGILAIDQAELTEDAVMEDALECGASDFNKEEDIFIITTNENDYSSVHENMLKKGYSFISAGIEMIPSSYISISDKEQLAKIQSLIDILENDDDVQNVWNNCESIE